jgi:hypothetical protein
MFKIIAFAGRKQSGKTSSCEFVQSIYDTPLTSNTAKIYNFADPLKQMCMDIFGLKRHQCYGTDDHKNELVNCYWPGTNAEMTAREVLQYVGTDVFRSMQNNVWADSTIRLIEKENPNLALIADCRFPNEVEAVKSVGGLVVKLNRNLFNSQHSSESALDENNYDQSNFDLVIDNTNLSIEEKEGQIHNLLIQEKVISL